MLDICILNGNNKECVSHINMSRITGGLYWKIKMSDSATFMPHSLYHNSNNNDNDSYRWIDAVK